MHRRSLLAATVNASFLLPGCLGSLSGCPDPDIENPVSYDLLDLGGSYGSTKAGEYFIDIITSEEDLQRQEYYYIDELDRSKREWFAETNFEAAFLLAIQVNTSAGSSELNVQGVDHADAGDITVYTCIRQTEGPDGPRMDVRFLQIGSAQGVPDEARLVHRQGDTKHVQSTTRN